VATLAPRVVEARLTELLAGLGEARPDASCAGSAGAELPEGRARLEGLLQRMLPGSIVRVVHDSHLVLAAAGVEQGIALIAGTGSVAYGRTRDGREARRGGWGWMLGDEGSGVWIAREAARLVMTRAESGFEEGTLDRALVRAIQAKDAAGLSARMHALTEPMEWASLASVVFETADADAGSRDIIRRAASELAKLVVEVRVPGPVVLAGGLLLHQPRLEQAVRKSLPHRDCVRLERQPVDGAVRLAEELLRA
jgi:N-acetylglucosamine kinase-like BadF-type ATPase